MRLFDLYERARFFAICLSLSTISERNDENETMRQANVHGTFVHFGVNK